MEISIAKLTELFDSIFTNVLMIGLGICIGMMVNITISGHNQEMNDLKKEELKLKIELLKQTL